MNSKTRMVLPTNVLASLLFLATLSTACQLSPAFPAPPASPSAEPEALSQQQQPLPTPRGPITRTAPNPPPLPTLVGGRPNVTPTFIPATKVRFGQVREIPPGDMLPLLDRSLFPIPGQPTTDKYRVVTQDSTRRYQVRSGREHYDTVRRTFVYDLQTGQNKQLGHDGGESTPAAITDQYLLWWFRCYDNCETSSPPTGLYVYDFSTATNILLAEDTAKRDYKADGRWIGYVKIKGTGYCFGELYVMNVDTKQERFVDAGVPSECMAEKGYFALSNNRVVWDRAGASGPGRWGFGLLDLATGQQRDLRIPDVGKPRDVGFSGDYIIWGRFGYDLRQDVVFNFPRTVPGWEDIVVQFSTPPVVKNENVYWGEGVGGQIHYFVAPLVRVAAPYPGP
jgi:hypothetical protein